MEGERNYHIFYQMLVGMDPAEKKKNHLKNTKDYDYLRQENCVTCREVAGKVEFSTTLNAMKVGRY